MRLTTKPIRSTTEEKRRVRVYCRSATFSNNSSTDCGESVFSRRARTMTGTGLSWANRSKTSLSSIRVASMQSDSLAHLYAHLQRAGWVQPTNCPEKAVGFTHPTIVKQAFSDSLEHFLDLIPPVLCPRKELFHKFSKHSRTARNAASPSYDCIYLDLHHVVMAVLLFHRMGRFTRVGAIG